MKNYYKKLFLISLLILGSFFILANLTLAQVDTSGAMGGLDKVSEQAGLKVTGERTQPSLATILGTYASTALGFAGTIMLALIGFAGFTWMTANGNEEKIAKAKKIITGAVIGILIAIISYSAVIMFNRGTGGIAPDINVSYEPEPGEVIGTCVVCENLGFPMYIIDCTCTMTPETGCTTVGSEGTSWSDPSVYPSCSEACAVEEKNGNNCN